MLCPRCQTECPEENNFCHKCGADLHEQRVRDNLSLRLPSGHTENKKPDFLPIQPALAKTEAEKGERRPVSLSKSPELTKSSEPTKGAGGVDLSKKAVSEPEQPREKVSLQKEPVRSGAVGAAFGLAESVQEAGEAEEVSAAEVSADLPKAADTAELSESAAPFEDVGSAGLSEASGALSQAEEPASGGEEVFVGIPQRVSVFSGHGGREGSRLNTQELVDKTLAGWNALEPQHVPTEKQDGHVGLKAEDASERSPFTAAVQSASQPEPEPPAPLPASKETRVLRAENGEEIAGLNTDFRTVKNVFGGNASAAPASGPFSQGGQAGAAVNSAFGGSAPAAPASGAFSQGGRANSAVNGPFGGSASAPPTSEAFSQREHAKAIINEVPRASGKGNDSASAGKVGIVIASCGCLVLFALIAFCFVVWLLCF